MGSSPSVLLLDDGELEDIHVLLEELGVACARVRGGAIVKGTAPPKDLLVSTPRRIDAVADTLAGSGEPPIRVMVVQEDSKALRERLRRDGFDYLVRRPVHPEALRLLMLHCIYQGEEKRGDRRVPVGREVQFRCGLTTRRATLADLSINGCRLISDEMLEEGKRVRISIPAAMDAEEPIAVRGRISRSESLDRENGLRNVLGVEFEALGAGPRQALEMLIEDCKQGPSTLRSGLDPLPRPDPNAEPEALPPAAEAKPAAAKRPAGNGGPVRLGTLLRKQRGIVREINAARPVVEPVEAESDQTAAPETWESEATESTAASASQSQAASTAASETTPSEALDRRAHRRSRYMQKIPAFGNRALRVLVGRDLSVSGMRVDRLEGLSPGDRMHLAIYGEPGEQPLLVWGSILRDYGSAGGMAITFDPLSAQEETQLERLVANLPAVESLHDSEVDAMGTVVAEIVG